MENAISAEELSDLQQYNIAREQLQSRLGLIARQRKSLEAEEGHIFGQFDAVDREEQTVINRLKRKYDIPDNARINLINGAIEQ